MTCLQRAKLPGFMQDEAAQRFLSQSLPLCFEKLYDANEVFNKWPNSVFEEARKLTFLFFGVVIATIPYNIKPVWETFTRILSSKSQLHSKITWYRYSSRTTVGWQSLLDAIERAGASEETAVIVVADHGMQLADERVTGDWDAALRAAGVAVRDEGYGFLYLPAS